MDKGKGIEGERDKVEANNSLVSSVVIRGDIVNVFEYLRMYEYDEFDPFKLLKVKLKILLRFSYANLEDSKATDTQRSYTSWSEDDYYDAFLRIQGYIKSCVCSEHHSKSRGTMTEDQLVELLESILVKLHDLSSIALVSPLLLHELSRIELLHDLSCIELLSPLLTALENVCKLIIDFYGLKVNNCVELDQIDEYVIPQLQLMAERVEHICWVLLADQLHEEFWLNEEVDFPRDDIKLAHRLVKVIHVGLDVMHICFTYVKASKSADRTQFVKQLVEVSPDILKEFLVHLQNHMVNIASSGTSAQQILIMIEFLLLILTDMHKDFIYLDKVFDLLVHVQVIVKGVSILVSRLEDKLRDEECGNELSCTITYLLENIKLLKGDLRHVYLKAPKPYELCFPMSDGPLFISSLLVNLKVLLNSNTPLVAMIKEEIRLVKEDLEFIRSFFRNVEQELNKDIWKCVFDVAYESKYVINSILTRDDGLLHIIFSLPNAIKKIKLIKEDSSSLPRDLILNNPKKTQKKNSLIAEKIMVGFKEERDLIVRKLTNGPSELDVISIIGMPGLGKTTLAYKVYNDSLVIRHFDIRAWCTVDQEYDRKKILQKILNQVTGSDGKFKEDTEVDDMLRKKLHGGRYLIVLDDLWDTESWDDLTRYFPRVAKGSRIMLTSRKKEVALHGKHHSDPLYLRQLMLEESWELLEKRVFQEERCPVDLLDVGKEIAQNCQGLPLVVDLIAGLMAMREKERIVWLELLKDLKSFIFNNGEEVMKVIQLSYNQLTDHLKLCLLYLGSYKKDEEIEINELKALWSAEGFVEKIAMKSVEDVMEDYLDHLVSSSLVMVSKGEMGQKACQIHDLIHDFCLLKSRKGKLFEVINSSNLSSSSSDLMPRQLTIHYNVNLPGSDKSIFMLNLKNKRYSSCKNLLSLKLTTVNFHEELPFCGFQYLRHFSLLRVLNIDTNLDSLFSDDYLLNNEIPMLVHLRYLKIRTRGMKSLPLSFSNLSNLETLMVNDSGTYPMVLEPVMWNLAMLRFMEIIPCCLYDLETDEPDLLVKDSKLENLRILEQLRISCSKGPVDLSKRFPNLQKLDCKVVKSWDSSAGCNWFPHFGFLNELEELYVSGPGYGTPCEDSLDPNEIMSFEARYLSDFSFFPLSLRYLVLSSSFVTSESLSTIARLPNLAELSLICVCIKGNEWHMLENDTFQNLRLLVMYSVSISEWHVGEEQFPVLEHLTLESCCKLKEIPPSFGDIYSLKAIELIGSPQLEESANKIKEYVEEMTGDDKLQVLVRFDESANKIKEYFEKMTGDDRLQVLVR